MIGEIEREKNVQSIPIPIAVFISDCDHANQEPTKAGLRAVKYFKTNPKNVRSVLQNPSKTQKAF